MIHHGFDYLIATDKSLLVRKQRIRKNKFNILNEKKCVLIPFPQCGNIGRDSLEEFLSYWRIRGHAGGRRCIEMDAIERSMMFEL